MASLSSADISTPCCDFVEKFFALLIEQAHQPADRAGNGPAARLVAAHRGLGDAKEGGQLVHCEVVLHADDAEMRWFHARIIAGSVSAVNYRPLPRPRPRCPP